MKLLHIDSSPLGTASASRTLTAKAVAAWVSAHPETIVERLDLAVDAPSHLDGDSLSLRLGIDESALTPAQKRENEVSERLVSQFLGADVVVIGAPMYNFSVPSQLKAWIDRIAQAGRTFRYTANGPEGLAGGKTVIVVSTRGGQYAGRPIEFLDHQESYLKGILGFMGIADLRFVRAEGLNMGEQARAKGLSEAAADIAAHVAGARELEAAA